MRPWVGHRSRATEVNKPNTRDGILAERNRINARFRNPKFRHFVNLTQPHNSATSPSAPSS